MPVLQLGLDISKMKTGAVQAANSLNEIARSAENVQKNADDLGDAFASAAKHVLALVGAYQTLEGMKNFVQRGVEFNSMIEQSRIGIGSLITAMVTLQDEQGRILEGQEKYVAAQGLAADMMKEIQRLGLETTATTEELVQGVQNVMGSAIKAGLTLQQIPRFAVASAQAMQTMGIPLEQMRTELDALLTGNINKSQDLLAPRLGVDKETIESWKEQGVLFERIMDRLAAFETAGADVAQTWKGLTSNFEEAMDVLAGQSASGISENLKDAVSQLQDLILTTEGGMPRISDDVAQIADVFLQLENALGGAILDAVEAFADAVRSANSAIEEMGGSEALFGRIETAVKTLSAAFASLYLIRKTGAADALKASQESVTAVATEQRAAVALAASERDAALAVKEQAAQTLAAAQANVNNAKAELQIAQASVQSAQARQQSAYASTKLEQALVRQGTATRNLSAARQEARSAAAALSAAENTLAQAEQRLTQISQQAAAATSLQAQTLTRAQSMWGTFATAVSASVSKVSAGLRSLSAALGGPVGIAITAITAGIAYFSTKQDDAARAAELHTQALKEFEAVAKRTTDEVGKQTTALTQLEKQRLAAARADAEKAYQLQLKESLKALNEIVSQQENLRASVQGLGIDEDSFLIPEQYITSLQELSDGLKSGKIQVDEFQERLAALRNEAVAAGHGNTDFVKSLDAINSKGSVIDLLAGIAQSMGLISDKAREAGESTVQAVNKMAAGIQGLEDALAKSGMNAFLAGLGSQERSAAQFLATNLKMGTEQIQKALAGDYAGAGVSKEQEADFKKMMDNLARASATKATSSKSGGSASSSIDSARKSIADLRQEIAVMNGEATKTGATLTKKFAEIASTGKTAGMSAEQIASLQSEYQKAFTADTLKDFNKELLQIQGNSQALKELEISEKLKEWKANFEAAGMSADQYVPKLEQLQAALEKQQNVQNLQTAVDFYKELGELSGEYGASIEYQNKLIQQQAELYINSGITPALVEQWQLLQQLENARDPFSGIARSSQQYFADATDYASKMGSIWTNTMDDMADALTNFVTSGKLDFQDLANSFIQQVIRMQMQAAISGLFKGISSVVSGFFGGDVAAQSESAMRGASTAFAADGGVFSGNISALSGRVYDKPTFFSFNSMKPFARGGVLGEAGPEAVMPLTRLPNGSLGVQAIGGVGEMPVTVNIINQTGVQANASATATTSSNGGMNIEVMIDKIVAKKMNTAGTATNRAVRNFSGVQQQIVRQG